MVEVLCEFRPQHQKQGGGFSEENQSPLGGGERFLQLLRMGRFSGSQVLRFPGRRQGRGYGTGYGAWDVNSFLRWQVLKVASLLALDSQMLS